MKSIYTGDQVQIEIIDMEYETNTAMYMDLLTERDTMRDTGRPYAHLSRRMWQLAERNRYIDGKRTEIARLPEIAYSIGANPRQTAPSDAWAGLSDQILEARRKLREATDREVAQIRAKKQALGITEVCDTVCKVFDIERSRLFVKRNQETAIGRNLVFLILCDEDSAYSAQALAKYSGRTAGQVRKGRERAQNLYDTWDWYRSMCNQVFMKLKISDNGR